MKRLKVTLREEGDPAKINTQVNRLGLNFSFNDSDFNNSESRLIYYSLFFDQQLIGCIYGRFFKLEKYFLFYKLFLIKEYRTQDLILAVINDYIQIISKKYQINDYRFDYELARDQKDAHFLLFKLIFKNVVKENTYFKYKIKTKDFNYIRNFSTFQPNLFLKYGYQAVPATAISKEVEERIRVREEKLKKNDPTYLTPFINFKVYEKTSFFLMDSAQNIPYAWIISRESAPQTIHLCHWYAYPEIRGSKVSTSFVTFVLNQIAQNSEYLTFKLACNNYSIINLIENYLTPINSKIGNTFRITTKRLS